MSKEDQLINASGTSRTKKCSNRTKRWIKGEFALFELGLPSFLYSDFGAPGSWAFGLD